MRNKFWNYYTIGKVNVLKVVFTIYYLVILNLTLINFHNNEIFCFRSRFFIRFNQEVGDSNRSIIFKAPSSANKECIITDKSE